jgi:phosphoribosylanthranilate isomerase
MSVSELRALITQYRAAGVAAIVLDTLVKLKDTAIKGGTGQVCDWDIAQQLAAEALVPLFLAGGIGPANVRAAITAVRPYGIDLSSGVEQTPGKKDPRKIAELMRIVRTA